MISCIIWSIRHTNRRDAYLGVQRTGRSLSLHMLLCCSDCEGGPWRGSSPDRQRTWKGFAGTAETNRWVSLQAAVVLKHAGRFDVPLMEV
ncbi:MAG: hypothetical protein K8I60_22620 [Anaerolineae bacterium]|nr:hypothetical protein [Anaerolineae bacterium]